MSLLFTEQVTLILRGEATGDYDERGRPIYGPDEEKPWPAWYEPRSSEEALDARDQVTWGYWVYLEGNPPVDRFDRVKIGGITYEVDGEPGRQPGGFLIESYVQFACEIVTG